jgi:GH43 family beta-xylosidase
MSQPFVNPVLRQRADPWAYRHTDGYYYFTASVPEYDRIELRLTRDLRDLHLAETRVIWRKHADGPMSWHIWAPEIHFIDGKWFVYFAAGEAKEIWKIRIYALECTGDPITSPWIERGQIKTDFDSFSLDATTFVNRGQRYLSWAQKSPDGDSDIYLARMKSPTELHLPATRISRPDLAWERIGFNVNEGPAVLMRNGRIFISYSASATDHHYCMGLLSAPDDADLTRAESWTKSPVPVLQTQDDLRLFGPGHNSFTVDVDGKSDLLVYHARDYKGVFPNPLNDPNRHTRVQSFTWCADGMPDFSAVSRELSPCRVSAVRHDATVRGTFDLRANVHPDGTTLGVDHTSLLKDGKPWLPVMGEIHYSRTPRERWRELLLKMRAGGIDVVASYVFWIHHEEIEGQFDFTGDRDLRTFAQTCADIGMPFVVRCGPWCHGEVRNGGLPDWVLTKPFKQRSTDAGFLDCTRKLYAQIARQLDGLLWKQGGPVVGIQVDNEFGGPGEYLLALKSIAREVGLDVPYITRTGWPSTSTPIPFGELLPLYGAYAEGFWSRELTSMPGHYWRAFTFEKLRTDVEVGMDQLGVREAKDDTDAAQYPYLTCELGGGMEQSYHRRLRIAPDDVLAVALAKIGSGGNLPGYYMYAGGTNPEGKLTTLQESQATNYWNDVPVKSYDFQAPLGQFGQVNPSYHRLRRLHLFLRDWGEQLARMPAAFPHTVVNGRDDSMTLRWSVRSDGTSGFAFIVNHQRGLNMPAKHGVRLQVDRPDGTSAVFPDEPIDIPSGALCVWPFELKLGEVHLRYATAELICRVELDDGTPAFFFAQTPGVRAEFAFAHGERKVMSSPGEFDVVAPNGRRTRVVLVSDDDSVLLWKISWRGRDRVVRCDANLYVGGDALHVYHDALDRASLTWWPSDAGLPRSVPLHRPTLGQPRARVVAPAAEPRTIKLGQQGVAESPSEADWDRAAVWEIDLPKEVHEVPNPHDVLVRIDYAGDVARAECNGKLVSDNFNNGRPFDVSLALLAKAGGSSIRLRVLPRSPEAPIFYPAAASPPVGTAALNGLRLIAVGRAAIS